MKYLKIYEQHEDIVNICRSFGINGWIINQDGTVDADDVDLGSSILKKIPIQFRKTGDFIISDNYLRSLKGCPVECHSLDCSYNLLKSLRYSPKIVNGGFNCSYNNINSLIHGPKTVNGYYNFQYNEICDFNGFPENYNFDFYVTVSHNILYEICELVDEDTTKFIKYLIEFNVIHIDEIDESRLDQAYYTTTGKQLSPDKKIFKNYRLI